MLTRTKLNGYKCICPPMLRIAFDKGIPVVMLNTNGIRIARDDRFLAGPADIGPTIYLQFDGFSTQTHETIRGRDLVDVKLKALDRLGQAELDVVLVPAIEKGVDHGEVGDIVRFGIEHLSIPSPQVGPENWLGIRPSPAFHFILGCVRHKDTSQVSSDLSSNPLCQTRQGHRHQVDHH